MSEKVKQVMGVAVMAAIVAVGVLFAGGDDTDFSRNASFRGNPNLFQGRELVKEADELDEIKASLAQIDKALKNLSAEISDHSPAVESWIDYVTIQCSHTQPELLRKGIEDGAISPHYLSEFWEDATEGITMTFIGLHREAFERCVGNFLLFLTVDDAQQALAAMGYPSGVMDNGDITDLVCPSLIRPVQHLFNVNVDTWFKLYLDNGKVLAAFAEHDNICS